MSWTGKTSKRHELNIFWLEQQRPPEATRPRKTKGGAFQTSGRNVTRSFVGRSKTLSTQFRNGFQILAIIDFEPLKDVKERGNMVASKTRKD